MQRGDNNAMRKTNNMNCVDLKYVSKSCGNGFTASLRGNVSKANTTKQSINKNIDCFGDESPRNDDRITDYHESASANSRNDKVLARAGFGMMFAIIITILVATLGVLAIRFSTQTLNTTTNEYIAIQLDLYLNSTTELAILYVQRNGFVCEENAAQCDLGEAGKATRRANVEEAIEKYIKYGANGEYSFKYKMTPLANYDSYNTAIYSQPDEYGTCTVSNNKPCFKEETKNAFILDIAGSVTNPITNQTLRVTKRQIIKP